MPYIESNVARYYSYRKRLMHNFVSLGVERGQSLVFANRHNQVLRTGETTLLLGSYIGFLALEYAIFKKSNLGTEVTVRELYHALFAVNRVDLFAEVMENNSSPVLNGYLVRDDVDDATFFANNPNINANTQNAANSNFFPGSGQTVPVSQARQRLQEPGGDPNSVISRDHIIRIIWGLMLVTKLLDDGIEFNDGSVVNQPFQDGIFDFKEEARAICDRIVNYLISVDWKITSPTGRHVAGANMKQDKSAILRAQAQMHGTPYGYSSWNFFYESIGPMAWMNGRMGLEKYNLKGNSFKIYDRCYYFGYEPYFCYYGLIMYDWGLGSNNNKNAKHNQRLSQLKKTTEFYLSVAPCTGTFKHTDDDFAMLGWATPDRSERSIRDTFTGHHEIGQLNSLDYLLMHNLYYLYHFDELGKFPEELNQDCKRDCGLIDKGMISHEIARAKAYNSSRFSWDIIANLKGCFDDLWKTCNNNLNACKANAQQAYNNCRNNCTGFFIWRAICRLGCLATYLLRLITCNIVSVACKVAVPFQTPVCAYNKALQRQQYYNLQIEKSRDYCK